MGSLKHLWDKILPGKPESTWPGHLFGLSDVGRVREHNEDCFGIDADLGIFIVADGMGGHNAGEVASQIAVNLILELVKDKAVPRLGREDRDIAAVLHECLSLAHEAILDRARQNPEMKGMGTTVVLALQDGDCFHVSNVGDARAYLLCKEGVKLLSQDHSVVMTLVEAGKMTLEEARFSHLRNELTQALGAPYPIEPAYARIKPHPSEQLLLCSDGLWDMLSDDQIWEISRSFEHPAESCGELIRAANAAGGEDNITVLLVNC